MANFWSVLMRRMRGAGHEVICMVPAGDVPMEGRLAALGACPPDAPGFPKAPALRIVNYPLDRKGLNPLWDAATFASLYKTFLLEKPDMLFATTIKPVIYGCMAAKLAGVEHIYATILILDVNQCSRPKSEVIAEAQPDKLFNDFQSVLIGIFHS